MLSENDHNLLDMICKLEKLTHTNTEATQDVQSVHQDIEADAITQPLDLRLVGAVDLNKTQPLDPILVSAVDPDKPQYRLVSHLYMT